MNNINDLKMSLQGCLASRKDCSGAGKTLSMREIIDICKSTNQAASSKSLFVVLPEERHLFFFLRVSERHLSLCFNRNRFIYSFNNVIF